MENEKTTTEDRDLLTPSPIVSTENIPEQAGPLSVTPAGDEDATETVSGVSVTPNNNDNISSSSSDNDIELTSVSWSLSVFYYGYKMLCNFRKN